MAETTEMSDLKMRVSLLLMKYLLPLPVVRRSYKLRLYTELVQRERQDQLQLPPELRDVLFIGSQYEGLSVTITTVDGGDAIYAMSDYDMMAVLNKYEVQDEFKSDEDASKDADLHSLEICEASHPGYCRLRSRNTGKFVGMRFNEDCSGKVDIFHDGVHSGETKVPYADVIVGFFEKPDTVEIKTFVHGPAISCTKIQIHPGNITKTGQEVDVVLSIKCHSWPLIASEWLERVESGMGNWPSKDTMDKVKAVGCYVVAVPHPLRPNPREEWRYSFAPSEKILARSFTFAQRGSYILAKMLFKTALQNVEKISSYCLKTQMFWLCEEESSAWSYEKVGYYALKVLSELADNLKEGVLRQYIIPNNNIISHIPKSTLHEVSTMIWEVVCNPFPVLQKIRRTTKYFGIILHPPEECFQPIISLLNKPNESNRIEKSFHSCKFSVMEHFCSMLKKPIVNIVQEEFSKLKFAILMDMAEDIGNDPNITETVDDMIVKIAEELSKYTEENVVKWYSFADEYKNSLDNIRMENVEEMLTNTYDRILKVEAF